MVNMNGYKVIYKDEVFNCLDMMMNFDGQFIENGFGKPKFMDVTIINKDNLIVTIRDEAWMFQFIREVKS